MPATRQLTPEEVETFQKDGVIVVRNAFDPAWVEKLKVGLEKSMSQAGKYFWGWIDDKETGSHFHNENRRWPDIEEYREFLFNSGVAELCAQAGKWATANLLYDSAFLRTPGTRVKTPWHQDLPYICVDGEDALISAWTPLFPVDEDSTLMCVRGSHRWNKNYYRLNFDPKGPKGHMDATGDDETLWDELPDIDADRSQYDIAAFAMEPGDTLIIHGMVIHGSDGNNRKDRPVSVVTARMLGDKAVYFPDKPGGTQPDFKEEAAAVGLKPGQPVDSPLFPRIWQATVDA